MNQTSTEKLPIWASNCFVSILILEFMLSVAILSLVYSYIKSKTKKSSIEIGICNCIISSIISGSIFTFAYVIAVIFGPLPFLPSAIFASISHFTLTHFHATNFMTFASELLCKKYEIFKELVEEDSRIRLEAAGLISLVVIVIDTASPPKANGFIFDLLTSHSGEIR